MMNQTKTEYATVEEWQDEARRLFGDDPMEWRFVCPSCKSVMTTQDYRDAGAPSNAVAISCVGRWVNGKRKMLEEGKGLCNYAGYGLIRINPVAIAGITAFDFDRNEEVKEDG